MWMPATSKLHCVHVIKFWSCCVKYNLYICTLCLTKVSNGGQVFWWVGLGPDLVTHTLQPLYLIGCQSHYNPGCNGILCKLDLCKCSKGEARAHENWAVVCYTNANGVREARACQTSTQRDAFIGATYRYNQGAVCSQSRWNYLCKMKTETMTVSQQQY